MKLVFAEGQAPQTLPQQGVRKIGSAPDADIVLDGPGMWPQHCELRASTQGLMLRVAVGASVSVNGRAVDGLIALRPGDRIGFGEIQATLVTDDAVQAMERTIVPAPANDDIGATMVRTALPKYVLRAQSGRMLGRTYPLSGTTVVGRSPECQLRLEESSLSRKHARLIPTDEGVVLEDLGSTNGSYLNGERVQRAVVKPGDEIGLDNLRFRLFEVGQEEQRSGGEINVGATQSVPRWVWVAAFAAAALILVAITLR
jgi:pSer/pThr/pTyr-binding forkhead associated (FHA) protein